MKNREKEIKELLYLKNELIKQTKKEIKQLHQELDIYYGEKRLVKQKQRYINNKRQN